MPSTPARSFSGLLLDVAMQLGLLKGGQVVDVDFDHVFTPCKKAGAKYSYKKDSGYFPGVYSINGLIAGVERGDGNTPVTFRQGDTHLRFLARLRERGMEVDTYRADCGSYTEDVVRSIYLNCRRFNIRAANSQEHYAQIQGVENWEEVETNNEKCAVAELCKIQETSNFSDLLAYLKKEGKGLPSRRARLLPLVSLRQAASFSIRKPTVGFSKRVTAG